MGSKGEGERVEHQKVEGFRESATAEPALAGSAPL